MTKKGTLAGFGAVSGDSQSNNNNININNNVNSSIDDLLGANKEKAIVTGIYFDPDVLRALDEISKGKKGAKTKIVNEAVKLYLKQNGLMD
jgi:hypothetical protein